MITHLARRVLALLSTLLVIVVLAFALLRIAPGGPFDAERSVPPEVLAALERHYGLDLPPYWNNGALSMDTPFAVVTETQLGKWLGGLVRGDLGPSFRYRGRSVNEILAAGAPASASIGLLALELAIALGVGFGAIAATHRDGLADRAIGWFAGIALAVPNYVVAVLLMAVLGLQLGLLPVGSWGTPQHLVMPAIALAIPHAAAIARLTRTSLIEVLAQEFVRTARAKGLSEVEVVIGHALRPALAPVVQYIGPAAAGLVTGSLAIEAIFNVPGVGTHFVSAAQNRDYTMVLGTVVVYATLLLVLNALADLAAAWLDPRVLEGVVRRRAGWISGAVLVLLALAAFVGPLVTRAPDAQSLAESLQAPSSAHLLGTDLKGRDLLARSVRGLGLSLGVGLTATAIAAVIGVLVGVVAGYAGGRIDAALMRVVDVLYGLPYIVFVVVLMVVFGRGVVNLFVAIGATSWLTMARIVRAGVRSLRTRPFVEAARALGASHVRIVLRHVVPNLAGTIVVYAALTVPAMIRQEALLSFLGLGVAPPRASLGTLLREGMLALSPVESAWWLLVVPNVLLIALVIALHGVADALRDRFDPRTARAR